MKDKPIFDCRQLHVRRNRGGNKTRRREFWIADAREKGAGATITCGASNAIGALGNAACAKGAMNHLNTQGLSIDRIIVPFGSAGTHAGRVCFP